MNASNYIAISGNGRSETIPAVVAERDAWMDDGELTEDEMLQLERYMD